MGILYKGAYSGRTITPIARLAVFGMRSLRSGPTHLALPDGAPLPKTGRTPYNTGSFAPSPYPLVPNP